MLLEASQEIGSHIRTTNVTWCRLCQTASGVALWRDESLFSILWLCDLWQLDIMTAWHSPEMQVTSPGLSASCSFLSWNCLWGLKQRSAVIILIFLKTLTLESLLCCSCESSCLLSIWNRPSMVPRNSIITFLSTRTFSLLLSQHLISCHSLISPSSTRTDHVPYFTEKIEAITWKTVIKSCKNLGLKRWLSR